MNHHTCTLNFILCLLKFSERTMTESTRSYTSLTQETSGYVGFANLPNQVPFQSISWSCNL